jgi:hypothetical protein
VTRLGGGFLFPLVFIEHTIKALKEITMIKQYAVYRVPTPKGKAFRVVLCEPDGTGSATNWKDFLPCELYGPIIGICAHNRGDAMNRGKKQIEDFDKRKQEIRDSLKKS